MIYLHINLQIEYDLVKIISEIVLEYMLTLQFKWKTQEIPEKKKSNKDRVDLQNIKNIL